MRRKLFDVIPVKMMRRCNDWNIFIGVLLVSLTLFIVSLHYKSKPVIKPTEKIPEGIPEVKRDKYGRSVMKDFVLSRRKRRAILEEACLNSTRDKTLDVSDLDHIIVSDKYKTLFCYVPKVACSQWKKVFMLMSGNISDPNDLDEYSVHVTYKHLLQYLSEYKPAEIKHRIQTYKTVLMVRDPFDRLLSAFKNKFHGSGIKDVTFRNIAKNVVRKYRKGFKEPVEGDDVTFLEFIKYVIDDNEATSDEHWRPVTKLCAPCQIGYDFIGKYETIDEDADFIMSQIAAHLEFPAKPEAYGLSNTTKQIPFYMSQLPMSYIGKLWDIYKDDFTYFNYSYVKFINDISYLV
ncbi:carbohydrate sulfotransferase 14-like [Ylistrum balloti]|uniref:carbohydrate sulfotransferase 14-like n=1 Tax=Ylistrum balloti TaxID=509963 RepID=UPI002905DB03|nr:carbohydrate sulfotransferase 14-like [Ylistrum balloti]